MAIQAIFGSIEFAADEPLREGRFPFKHFFPRGLPDQLPGLARPELGWLPDRFAIHSPVLSQTLDSGLAAKIGWWLESALFDKVRLDVVVHEQSLIWRRKS